MPTRRRRLARLSDGELDAGQRAWLLGEERPSGDIGLWPYNRWSWLWRAVERDGIAGDTLPDGSPGPRDLWTAFGADALQLWHRQHGDEPHPLIEHLGMPP